MTTRSRSSSPSCDGVPVGYVYAGLEPQSWKELREAAGFVHDVVVTGRRDGGRVWRRALMDAALAWLKSRGAPRVMLWTAEPNEAAQQLFAPPWIPAHDGRDDQGIVTGRQSSIVNALTLHRFLTTASTLRSEGAYR